MRQSHSSSRQAICESSWAVVLTCRIADELVDVVFKLCDIGFSTAIISSFVTSHKLVHKTQEARGDGCSLLCMILDFVTWLTCWIVQDAFCHINAHGRVCNHSSLLACFLLSSLAYCLLSTWMSLTLTCQVSCDLFCNEYKSEQKGHENKHDKNYILSPVNMKWLKCKPLVQICQCCEHEICAVVFEYR